MVEIANAIIAAKPYDRLRIPENYVGIAVRWPVKFAGLSQYQGDKWCVSFDSVDAEYRSVATFIDLRDYPEFKVLDWGHPAWIEGRILSADVRTIWLEDGAQITLG